MFFVSCYIFHNYLFYKGMTWKNLEYVEYYGMLHVVCIFLVCIIFHFIEA